MITVSRIESAPDAAMPLALRGLLLPPCDPTHNPAPFRFASEQAEFSSKTSDAGRLIHSTHTDTHRHRHRHTHTHIIVHRDHSCADEQTCRSRNGHEHITCCTHCNSSRACCTSADRRAMSMCASRSCMSLSLSRSCASIRSSSSCRCVACCCRRSSCVRMRLWCYTRCEKGQARDKPPSAHTHDATVTKVCGC
jgi:hypothetical protein